MKVAVRAKGVERSMLVTDAVAPAMCAAGRVPAGRGRDRTAGRMGAWSMRGGERLAGSSLRMDRAIGNVMRMAGVTLARSGDAWRRGIRRGWDVRRAAAGLEPGARADLVRFVVEDGRLARDGNFRERAASLPRCGLES